MKVRESDVLVALGKKHDGRDAFFTHIKNGPTQVVHKGELAIIDAVAIAKSWAHPIIRGYEVKVDQGDFLRDIKWHKYFDMCHEFSFVCPSGLIQADEVPEQAGLIYYNHDKKSLQTKKKAVYRQIVIPTDMLWYIIISQLKSDRYPFFSSQREYLEAWVADKTDRQSLGWGVREKIMRISEQIPTLERQLDRVKSSHEYDREEIKKANAILKPYGVQLGSWGWEEKLQRILHGGGSPDLGKVVELAKNLEMNLTEIHERTKQSTVLERSV